MCLASRGFRYINESFWLIHMTRKRKQPKTKLYPSCASESDSRSTEENKARESCQSSYSLELSMDGMSISVGKSVESEGKLEKIVAVFT